jgi:hypothetical protein
MQIKGSIAEQFWSFQPQALKALGVPNCAVPVPLVEYSSRKSAAAQSPRLLGSSLTFLRRSGAARLL